MYLQLYQNLCSTGKSLKESYGPGSGIHAHHILPKHMGGDDTESNITYLTVDQHIEAHRLLWMIYENPNDLRSMHMLGANLSTEYRQIIGKWCAENKIGFHGAPEEDRSIWRNRGLDKIKDIGYTICRMTDEERKDFAALGGKHGSRSQIINGIGIHNPKNKSLYASLGGKAHKGNRAMYIPGNINFIRVRPEDIEKRLSEGYIFGEPKR
jgi:hypothetical protein